MTGPEVAVADYQPSTAMYTKNMKVFSKCLTEMHNVEDTADPVCVKYVKVG